MFRNSGNTIHFSIFTMQIFSAAAKNNFNMPGGDKSRTCVRYVLEIINFTNCCTWLFSNKDIHEQNLSVFWVLKQS